MPFPCLLRACPRVTATTSALVPFILLLSLLARPVLASVELPNGSFHETVTDLSVKVPGGWATVLRTWYDPAQSLDQGGEPTTLSASTGSGSGGSTALAIGGGTASSTRGEWHLNRAWANLVLGYTGTATLGGGSSGGDGTASVGTLDGITLPDIWRNGDRYEYREGAEKPVWAFGNRTWIETTDQGFRWHNRSGDWIDYDADGRMSAYGDLNGVTVRVARDADHRITHVRDRLGRTLLTIVYNADGYPTEVRDNRTPEPRSVHYYWTDGQLTRVGDLLGNDWRYAYDDQGQLIRITDPENHSRHIGYDETGKTASVKDDQGYGVVYTYDYDRTKKEYYIRESWTDGRVVETWYDNDGRVIRRDVNGKTHERMTMDGSRTQTTFDQRGNATVRKYDEWENVTQVTYADGATETTSYDYRFHKPKEKVDALGRHTLYEYDDHGNLTRLTEAAGTDAERITEYRYDADGNAIEKKSLGDEQTAEAITRAEYDDFGNRINLIGPEGGVTRYTYDNQGKLLTRTDPNGHVWHYRYNLRGYLTQVVDAEDRSVSLEYNLAGRLKALTDARGHAINLTYDMAVLPIRVSDREGATTQLRYDLAGRLTQLVDPLGNTQSLDYDLLGELTGYTDTAGDRVALAYGQGDGQGGGADGQTGYPGLINRIQYPTFLQTFDYDVRNRLVGVINHLSESEAQATRTEYDKAGNRTATTDALDRTTQYRYDDLDRLVQIIDPAGQSTSFSYDDRDNLLSVTDPNGHTTRYAYDKADRQISETRPGGQTWHYEYDPAGQLTASADPDGRRSENDYDKIGQLIGERHYAPGQEQPERSLAYSYDPNGNLASWSDGTRSASYSYDKNDRLVSETSHYAPFTLSHAYSYDAAGHKQTYTGPGGATITYHWDKGRLTRIELPGQGSITVNSYHWTKPEQVTYPGGTKKIIGYDSLMRPALIQVQDPAELTVMDYRYQYDAAGNITRKSTEQGDYDYQYDSLDRLTQAKGPSETEGWAYDPNGNRVQDLLNPGTWRYDANDQLTESPLGTYRYDATGNTIEHTTNGTTTRQAYDADGQLYKVEDNDGNPIGQYAYDPFGRRISKATDEGTRYFYYTDEGLAGEYDATGSPIWQIGYWPDSTWTTVPLYEKTSEGYGFYQNDNLGTPQRIVTPNGATMWEGTYRAFGELVHESGGWRNPLRFPGQYEDGGTGWHYNYFRYYDSSTGRYVESDPIGLGGGLNTYAYAGGNPLIHADPLGLIPPGWAKKFLHGPSKHYNGNAMICNTGFPISPGIPHTFLCSNGKCGGKHGGNSRPKVYTPTSEIRDDSGDLPYASCSYIPKKNCNQTYLNECIEKSLRPRPLNERYMFDTDNCGNWAEETILKCIRNCA